MVKSKKKPAQTMLLPLLKSNKYSMVCKARKDFKRERNLKHVKPMLLSDALNASTQSANDEIMTHKSLKSVLQVSLVCEVDLEHVKPKLLAELLCASTQSTDDESMKSVFQVSFTCKVETIDERKEMVGEEQRPMMLNDLLERSMQVLTNVGCNSHTEVGEQQFNQRTTCWFCRRNKNDKR